jgi:putative FmdB family regulatory protein
MPTYEYKCEKGHAFELEQPISEEPIAVCRCGAPCRRQLFPAGFTLKGTGWAKDGYSNSGGGKKKSKKKE